MYAWAELRCPLRPGPHQILNKMTSGPHQKMISVTRPHQWMATLNWNTLDRLVKSLNVNITTSRNWILYYITIQVLVWYNYTRMCARGAGHCDVLRIFQAHTQLHTYACQRNSPLAWCIDCGAQIFAASH